MALTHEMGWAEREGGRKKERERKENNYILEDQREDKEQKLAMLEKKGWVKQV